MDDDDGHITFDIADFKEDRGRVRSDDHREPITEVPDPDRVPVRVKDLLLAEIVLQGRWRDDGIFSHNDKLTCRTGSGKHLPMRDGGRSRLYAPGAESAGARLLAFLVGGTIAFLPMIWDNQGASR
jgi:hypothetical protein